MAATLMTCHRHFYIWSSVSGRWFEISSLLLVVKVLDNEGLVNSKYIFRKKCLNGQMVAILMTF